MSPVTLDLSSNIPSSSDDPMIPRLSRSHRTTAPAMATEPWKQRHEENGATPATISQSEELKSLYLECIKGGLVPTQFVRHSGQKAVVRHHRLQNDRKKQKNAAVRNVCTINKKTLIFTNVPSVQCFAGENSRFRTC